MKLHTPVLLQEVIEILDPKSGDRFIDTTVGGGGHTKALLQKGAAVLGIDRDPRSIEFVTANLASDYPKCKLVQGNFAKIGQIAKEQGFSKVSGILFDLGFSSSQLEEANRGFSFQKEAPLDMRMDPTLQVTASDLVNNLDKRRLHEIFNSFAQEKLSWPIADAICLARKIRKIETTGQLAVLVSEVYRRHKNRPKLHAATKTFQALRIVVNSELLNLEEALPQTVDLLEKGGRLVVISFHSLEDSIVKRFFKQSGRLRALTPKPIHPGAGEILENPRSRSARLRASERI